MVSYLTRCCLLFALSVSACHALAQVSMADPTRPPGIDGQNSGEFTEPLLQSIMFPKHGKPIAVIGGQQVMIGEMYGRSRLVEVNEQEVVLAGPNGAERLSLTPGIEKSSNPSVLSVQHKQKKKDKP